MHDSNPGAVSAPTLEPPSEPVSPGEESLRPDRVGRYLITTTLGSGGFGAVYKAFDEELRREIAIKVPHASRIRSEEDIESYLAEARALAGLDHPGIVPVYDVGRTDDGRCYLVSKFIEGKDLSGEIRSRRFSHEEAAELVASLAEALHHAHQRGLVHRDVKPANVLLDPTGAAYIADFGLALRDDDVMELGTVVGTPQYMSPEQASGEAHRVDARSDVYSLGVVLYELLTRRTPFRAKTIHDLIKKITTGEPRPPRQIDDKIPKPLDRICLKAVSRKVRDRYSTAKDFAEDLREWLAPFKATGTVTGVDGRTGASDSIRPESPPVLSTATPSPGTSAGAGSSRGGSQISSVSGPVSGGSSILNPEALSVSDLTRVLVVPKGLRSFGPEDANFFLELLPGPRDREGLPDSVRFWKKQIEETDPEATFAIGLIYGPSGCGKSSMVKAGIIPRLRSNVTPFYLEATPNGTEERILKGLRRLFPHMPQDRGLPESLLALRQGEGLPRGEKLVLVIDQFEQWLHMHRGEAESELVQALRQCDPSRVQCVIMVRDDFWMSVSRFMREIEVWLVEGHNSAAVDLFSLRHARKVLSGFGRALGSLPERDQDLSEDQKEFVRRAVEDLSENGRVISVRLALFADMLKNRPWSMQTLREVGGAEGIGTRFFEETFSSQSAPPEHRLHQQAARRVLRSLIFLSGHAADIKGGIRTHSELLEASGYTSRPEAFEHLMLILDRELRIVTPTDSSGVGLSLERGEMVTPEDAEESGGESREPCYQLTHDYLVRPLRLWLTKKQRETMRGRAELRLSDRATLWSTKPQKAYLPSAWEWANIRLLTRRRDWTGPQKRMMRSATRRHATRLVLLLIGLAGLGLGTHEVHGRLEARALHERVLYVEPAEVSRIVEEMEPFRRWIDPLLEESIASSEADPRKKLNASLALLPADPAPLEYLRERAFELEGAELDVVSRALIPHHPALSGELWKVLEGPKSEESRRLRAATLLARLETAGQTPGESHSGELDPRWKRQAPFLVERLIALSVEDTARHDDLLRALKPVGRAMLEALGAVYRDLDRSESDRSVAQNVAREFTGSYVPGLVDLLVTTGLEGRHAESFQLLEGKSDAARESLRKVLAVRLEDEEKPEWKDAPLLPGWDAVDPADHAAFEAARGWIDERFAFCQTMALDVALEVVERLRKSGYRPMRFRPFAHGDGTLVAAAWTRDVVEWRLETGLKKEQVRETASRWSVDGYVPRDLAGYLDAGELRFALVGMRDPDLEWIDCLAGIESQEMRTEWDRLNSDANRPMSWHVTRRDSGELLYSSIWLRGKSLPGRTTVWLVGVPTSGLDANEFLPEEISVVATPSPSQYVTLALERARAEFEKSPEEPASHLDLGKALHAHELDEEAVEVLTRAVEKHPRNAQMHWLRSASLCRLGRLEEARADLNTMVSLGASSAQTHALEAIVEGYSGKPFEAAREYRARAERYDDDASYLYQCAETHALLAALAERSGDARAPELRRHALELIEATLELNRYYQASLVRPGWEVLRQDADFRALEGRLQLDLRVVGYFIGRPELEGETLVGIDVDTQLARSRELAADGYRLRSISVTTVQPDAPPLVAAVWQRPRRQDRSLEARALRRTHAALLLARLGEPEHLWPLLKLSPQPHERAHLIHHLSASGIGPELLLKRLEEEPAVSVRRAILLALGDFDVKTFSEVLRTSSLETIAQLFERDPDPGVHSASEWLLDRWGEGPRLEKLRERLAGAGSPPGTSRSRRWRIDSHGNTLVRLDGPIETELGSDPHEIDRGYHEQQHRRRIPRSYEISTREVTVAQFRKFIDANPGLVEELELAEDVDPREPVQGVTWIEARRYCDWLSEQERSLQTLDPDRFTVKNLLFRGRNALDLSGYRLPTEWEWEYAVRAGTRTAYAFGNSPARLKDYGWFEGSSDAKAGDKPRVMPVGQLRPGDLGLFDAHGNVVELCQNPYVERFFSPDKKMHEDTTGGRGELVNTGTNLSIRGGHATGPADWCRSSSRGWRRLDERKPLQGFRVARSLPVFRVLPGDRVFRERAELLVTGEPGDFVVDDVPAGLEVVPGRGVIPARLSVRATDGEARAFAFAIREVSTDRLVTARGVITRGPEWKLSHHDWIDKSKSPRIEENWREIVGRTPLATRTTPELEFLWASEPPSGAVPADHFTTIAETSWTLPAGRYEFALRSDDGARISVGERLVINGWGGTSGLRLGEIELEAGEHPIRIEHYETAGLAYLVLEVRRLP